MEIPIQNSISQSGDSPLHMAVRQTELEAIWKILDEKSVNVNCLNTKYETPLHLACELGNTAIIQLLVAYGGDALNIRDSNNTVAVFRGGRSSTIDWMTKLLYHDLWIKGPDSNERYTLLHEAVVCGKLESVQEILDKHSIDVNCLNSDHETPLHLSCALGYIDIVRFLMSCGANMYIRDSFNNAPIHRAVAKGHNSIVEFLINKCSCDSMIRGFQGRTLLHFACATGNVKLLNYLIAKFDIDPSINDSGNVTPLHIASQNGFDEPVEVLIMRYGCNVDILNKRNQTPLHLACLRNHLSVVRKLISKHKADIYACDKQGCTPIQFAALGGCMATVQALITEFGCQPTVGFKGRTILHTACHAGCVELVDRLISGFNQDPLSVDNTGESPLHCAALSGQTEVAKILIAKYKCPVDIRNIRDETPLHIACFNGHLDTVNMLLYEHRADLNAIDNQGNKPLHKAAMGGYVQIVKTLISEFGDTLNPNDFLLHLVCRKGHLELAKVLLSDYKQNPSYASEDGSTPLHIAAMFGQEKIARLLITEYNSSVICTNNRNETPLHLACSNGHLNVIGLLIHEHEEIRDEDNNTPLNVAAIGGHTKVVQTLIVKFTCNPNIKGFDGRTPLHQACLNGHVATAEAIIILSKPSVLSTDSKGNTPLHLSAMFGRHKCVQMLLYNYQAPLFLRNKAGKSALDTAKNEDIKTLINKFMTEQHLKIQNEYKHIQLLSSRRYSGEQHLVRVFILGDAGSGKSTLVESLKRKGVLASRVTEADVPLHTAGIIPSHYDSKKIGRILYFDFAGDREYYSSHAAILEKIAPSSVGTNVYFVVLNVHKDIEVVENELGYWLSFISFHCTVTNCRTNVVIICSHVDLLTSTDVEEKIRRLKKLSHYHGNVSSLIEVVDVLIMDCRQPRSTRPSVHTALQQIISKSSPCALTLESALILGMLEKDFCNVISCKLNDLLSHIGETGIHLPTSASKLYPAIQELHNIGLLMVVGGSKDNLEDHLLLLSLAALTHDVHRTLFSTKSLPVIMSNSVRMGILPESSLKTMLPEHITKEYLVQLQYCHEFTHAEVGLDYCITSVGHTSNHLLYFPALCLLDTDQSNLAPMDLDHAIGWYIEATRRFDYFPPRFWHVLFLRLAFSFALPLITRHQHCSLDDESLATTEDHIQAYNRRCTMWKTGIHWLMEEGVECTVENVNNSRGIVIITKSKEYYKSECTKVLFRIVSKILEAKSEFCRTNVLKQYFLNSGDSSSYSDENKLFFVDEVERVMREGKSAAVSISGRAFLDRTELSHLIKRHAYWGELP